jgi:glutaredoxin
MYSRRRCHLCDEARAAIMSLSGRVAFDFEEVDIDSSEQLVAEYGIRIPVVLVDGEEFAEYRIDPEALERELSPS